MAVFEHSIGNWQENRKNRIERDANSILSAIMKEMGSEKSGSYSSICVQLYTDGMWRINGEREGKILCIREYEKVADEVEKILKQYSELIDVSKSTIQKFISETWYIDIVISLKE